jgi:hypothetical protein
VPGAKIAGRLNRMMAVKPFPYALLLLSWVISSGAHADDFAGRCAQLPQQAKIAVVFHDREVTTDTSRNVQELNRMSGKPPGDYHNVYGITHAKPSFRMQVTSRMVADDAGRICAIPDMVIELGFSEFVVYLAKELTDPCHQDIIRQHEQDHVNTWKSQLRASAQLLTTVLRRDIGEARYYASREETEAGIRAWATELAAPWLKRILDTVTAAQGAIDTRVSYDTVTSRLRTCGQRIRGGSR